jgi:hypothetical protein
MRDSWWTNQHWGGQVFSEHFGPLSNHSTDCSTLIIIHHPGLVQQAK